MVNYLIYKSIDTYPISFTKGVCRRSLDAVLKRKKKLVCDYHFRFIELFMILYNCESHLNRLRSIQRKRWLPFGTLVLS